ncbi:hypothetical protein Agub_g11438, partial [Astrephomene gubernaculifera]
DEVIWQQVYDETYNQLLQQAYAEAAGDMEQSLPYDYSFPDTTPYNAFGNGLQLDGRDREGKHAHQDAGSSGPTAAATAAMTATMAATAVADQKARSAVVNDVAAVDDAFEQAAKELDAVDWLLYYNDALSSGRERKAEAKDEMQHNLLERLSAAADEAAAVKDAVEVDAIDEWLLIFGDRLSPQELEIAELEDEMWRHYLQTRGSDEDYAAVKDVAEDAGGGWSAGAASGLEAAEAAGTVGVLSDTDWFWSEYDFYGYGPSWDEEWWIDYVERAGLRAAAEEQQEAAWLLGSSSSSSSKVAAAGGNAAASTAAAVYSSSTGSSQQEPGDGVAVSTAAASASSLPADNSAAAAATAKDTTTAAAASATGAADAAARVRRLEKQRVLGLWQAMHDYFGKGPLDPELEVRYIEMYYEYNDPQLFWDEHSKRVSEGRIRVRLSTDGLWSAADYDDGGYREETTAVGATDTTTATTAADASSPDGYLPDNAAATTAVGKGTAARAAAVYDMGPADVASAAEEWRQEQERVLELWRAMHDMFGEGPLTPQLEAETIDMYYNDPQLFQMAHAALAAERRRREGAFSAGGVEAALVESRDDDLDNAAGSSAGVGAAPHGRMPSLLMSSVACILVPLAC